MESSKYIDRDTLMKMICELEPPYEALDEKYLIRNILEKHGDYNQDVYYNYIAYLANGNHRLQIKIKLLEDDLLLKVYGNAIDFYERTLRSQDRVNKLSMEIRRLKLQNDYLKKQLTTSDSVLLTKQ